MSNVTVNFGQLPTQNTTLQTYINTNHQASTPLSTFNITRGKVYNKRRPRAVKSLPDNIKKKIQQEQRNQE